MVIVLVCWLCIIPFCEKHRWEDKKKLMIIIAALRVISLMRLDSNEFTPEY